jgi:hypothetical protein
MKRLITVWSLTLALGSTAGLGYAAAQQTTAGDDAKKAGESTKEAGKDIADAAKNAGKATGKATKTGAKKAKKAVTGDAHATCVDGSVQAGVDEAAAAAQCKDHGGVAKK